VLLGRQKIRQNACVPKGFIDLKAFLLLNIFLAETKTKNDFNYFSIPKNEKDSRRYRRSFFLY
jgi:hypothetical protein